MRDLPLRDQEGFDNFSSVDNSTVLCIWSVDPAGLKISWIRGSKDLKYHGFVETGT